MNNNRSSTLLVALIGIVSLLGLGVLAGSVISWDHEDAVLLVVLASLTSMSELTDFSPFPNSRASVSIALIFAGGTISGLPGVAVVALTVALVDYAAHRSAFHKRTVLPLVKASFNLGMMLASGAAYVGVIEAFPSAAPDDWLALLPPAVLGAIIVFAINAGLLALAISLETGRSLFKVWNADVSWALPHYMLLAIVALFMAAAYHRWDVEGIALVLGPLAMAWLAIKQYTDGASTTIAAIGADTQL